MAATVGLTGQVTSWGAGGSFTALMLALLKPATFSVEMSADELDTTGYNAGAATVMSKIQGLRGWSGSFSGPLAVPTNGILGLVATAGTGYVKNAKSWNFSMRCSPLETTAWPLTAVGGRTFSPSLVEWGGSFDCLVDDTTVLTVPGAEVLSTDTLTLTLGTGVTLAGKAFTSAASVGSSVGGLQEVSYTFVGTGEVTSVGSTNIIPAASSIATPVAGTIELGLYSTTRKLSGSAFWTEISVRVSPDGVNQCTVSFQGSGALTPA